MSIKLTCDGPFSTFETNPLLNILSTLSIFSFRKIPSKTFSESSSVGSLTTEGFSSFGSGESGSGDTS